MFERRKTRWASLYDKKHRKFAVMQVENAERKPTEIELRRSEVVRLRDELGLTFAEISRRFSRTPSIIKGNYVRHKREKQEKEDAEKRFNSRIAEIRKLDNAKRDPDNK